MITWACLKCFYEVIFDHYFHGTIGVKLLGLRVVSTTGDRLSLGSALARNVLFLLSGIVGIYSTVIHKKFLMQALGFKVFWQKKTVRHKHGLVKNCLKLKLLLIA